MLCLNHRPSTRNKKHTGIKSSESFYQSFYQGSISNVCVKYLITFFVVKYFFEIHLILFKVFVIILEMVLWNKNDTKSIWYNIIWLIVICDISTFMICFYLFVIVLHKYIYIVYCQLHVSRIVAAILTIK